VNQPRKQVDTLTKKREMEANKEKERGTQSTLYGVVIRETRETRGPRVQSGTNPPKGWIHKSSHK
jgi:hypothetical protein